MLVRVVRARRVDVDVVDRTAAPGCPASVPGGISAWRLRSLVRALARDERVRSIDLTEVDATADTADGRTVRARSSFGVTRTVRGGLPVLFATGLYLDRIVVDGDRAWFEERIVVCDSDVIDTLLALPL